MTREERRDKATNMRGCNTELFAMREAFVIDGGLPEIPDGMSKVSALVPVAGQSEGIRKPEHAIEWLNEHDFVGSVMAMRRHPWGAEKNGIYTRSPQTTFTIT